MREPQDANLARTSTERLAHDLRNPLTIITARLQMIRRRRARGDVVPEWLVADLETFEAATAQLIALTERIDTPSLEGDHME